MLIKNQQVAELLSIWIDYRDNLKSEKDCYNDLLDWMEKYNFLRKDLLFESRLKEMSILQNCLDDLELFDYDINKIYRSGSNFDRMLTRCVAPYEAELLNYTFQGTFKEWIYTKVITTEKGKEQYDLIKDKKVFEQLIDLIQQHLDTAKK